MQRIESLDDPRVAAYRNLRERTLRGENLFIAEALLVVRRLLASQYPVESIFAADDVAGELRALAPPGIPIYVATRRLIAQIAGFPFHRGAMAVGRRRPLPSLEALLAPLEQEDDLTLIICPETTQAENLGMVFRTAAAFGVDAVLLGQKSCDPLCRRGLRVSMVALTVPFTRSADLAADIQLLRSRWRFRLLATVLDDTARRLPEVAWPDRAGLMIGNEYAGLSETWLAGCDERITIPMAAAADSLNLGVATGIFVYERMRGRIGHEGRSGRTRRRQPIVDA